MTNRHQYVSGNNSQSSNLPIDCGVPQGSVLGPFLFLLYMNDFEKCLQTCHVILFADDTTLFKEHECLKTLILHLSKDLENVVTWLKLNHLTLNIDKTKFLIFTHKELPSGINLRINDKILPISHSVEFLGIIIDYKFCNHIDKISLKSSKILGLFFKFKHIFPTHAFI